MKYTIETTLALLREHGIPEPVKEFRFDQERRWRFDFAWVPPMIALELDGATWVQGRHTRGKGYANDCEKLSVAAAEGWCVIRATTQQVESGDAAEWLLRAFNARAKG